MSVLIHADQLRLINLGQRVSKSTGALAASTVALFTIAGGRVAITSIYGLVGTAINAANNYKLQSNPTTGTTSDIVAATDIGTVATPVGDLLSFTGVATDSVLRGGAVQGLHGYVVVPIGQVESVSTGAAGEITWVVNWIPLDDGATLVAA